MELFSWGALVGWVCGVIADCLKAVVRQRILRRLGVEPPAPVPTADTPAPADTVASEPVPLVVQLQEAVARYRRGEPS
jgi:hypothetical protein